MMGKPAPKQDREEVMLSPRVAPVDPNAETPGARGLPPQGEPLKKASEETKGFYIYKGFRGVPFRSKSPVPPDIKAKDPRQPIVVADAQVRVFDLGNSTDLREYQAVIDGCAKGLYEFSAEERQWVPEAKTWFVFMRWGIRYWELPEE